MLSPTYPTSSVAPPTMKKARVSKQQQGIVLFYKYSPLSDDRATMSILRDALEDLCRALHLTGRILLGLSKDAEGINGTLAGINEDVEAFTVAMLGRERYLLLPESDRCPDARSLYRDALERFWQASEEFARAASVPVLCLDGPEDFKWSWAELADGEDGLFPDLNVKLVKEIISTGGRLSSVKLQDTKQGYLTPEEWHKEIQKLSAEEGNEGSNTVLIDCRNHKEYEIGHFENALDPNTKTFEQFPRWVAQNKSALEGKNVLMYCTGGIRCEKASAYIRRETGASKVQHLKGGIHKYLDKYGSNGAFQGKNFVFDKRGAAGTDDASKALPDDNVVGHCLYCEAKYDTFAPDSVCTVCREPTLVCTVCKSGLREYHCGEHGYLRTCYFTDFTPYDSIELKEQLSELEAHLERMAVGKRYKQKRKTLKRQCDRVTEALEKRSEGDGGVIQMKCRNCGDASCGGNCWGFHGLGRKDKLKTKFMGEGTKSDQQPRSKRASANQRSSKVRQRERDVAEIQRLGLSAPPSSHRCSGTSLRCPPPCIRVLQCAVKGKWCGRPVLDVIKTEFADLANDDHTAMMMSRSLIRLNGAPVRLEAVGLSRENDCVSASTLLKNMDVISRVVHWHEPPVVVSPTIHVTKIQLPAEVRDAYLADTDVAGDSHVVYCCDKPATVPVHPAGPYLSNSLTLMLEGQEGLGPRSIRPCHRLDRCTSGLTLCSTSPAVARLLQGRMEGGGVSKLYIARVTGTFPNSKASCDGRIATPNCPAPAASWTWSERGNYVEVNGPIENVDPINGIRAIREGGKPSCSRYSFISYDGAINASLIACFPVTGRGHQLRVHLQWLGYPIVGDVQYGSKSTLTDSQAMKGAAMQVLAGATKKEMEKPDKEVVAEDDARAAKELCRCCAGLWAESFSSAQLLEGGHSINLHAWKYRISFEQKAKKKKQNKSADGQNGSNSGEKNELASIVFSTELPSWGTAVREAEVAWLT